MIRTGKNGEDRKEKTARAHSLRGVTASLRGHRPGRTLPLLLPLLLLLLLLSLLLSLLCCSAALLLLLLSSSSSSSAACAWVRGTLKYPDASRCDTSSTRPSQERANGHTRAPNAPSSCLLARLLA